ncbi:tetratricopeptide repeat protein [Qipengyuania sp. DSG2-2]|uniref:tetratricopeptide repeat protein n=1 Tax=Qipengyuania sp. DGS2-2 TaxID=3349631 RepID=UPI0036D30C3B
MSWIAVVLLGAGALACGAVLLRDARNLWTLFAAALVFGLAGYAAQGFPGLPSAPLPKADTTLTAAPALIDARREFFDASRPPSRFVLTGDTYARRGDYETASGFYRNAVAENPNDGEGWLALAVALVEYADGRGTPGALLAYQNARDALPGNPAVGYFAALPELRAGRLPETRELWAEALEGARENAPGYGYVQERVDSLDNLMAAIVAQGGS